jgi:hypothetical protein
LTGLIGTLAVIALIAIGVWLLGSIALRLSGLLLVLAGLFGTATGQPAGLLVAVLGGLAWLGGHWLYAFKHHQFRSALAGRLFATGLLARADPTRGWGVPTLPTERPTDRR